MIRIIVRVKRDYREIPEQAVDLRKEVCIKIA
jgi:hypothetical protein